MRLVGRVIRQVHEPSTSTVDRTLSVEADGEGPRVRRLVEARYVRVALLRPANSSGSSNLQQRALALLEVQVRAGPRSSTRPQYAPFQQTLGPYTCKGSAADLDAWPGLIGPQAMRAPASTAAAA